MSARISSISVAAVTAQQGTGGYRRAGMTQPGHFRPSQRSLWLTELAAALEQAQRVLDRLDPESARSDETLHLRGRIAAIWSEVDQLRRGTFARGGTGGAGP
jgi:hypothetical protein